MMTERRKQFEEIALPHLDSLYSLALRLCRSRRDAEDLVQDTWLRAFAAWDTFVPGSNVRGWLCRILTNLFINGHRRERRAGAVPIDVVTARAYSASARRAAEDPEAALVDDLLRGEVDRALASLPDEHRVVVLLCDVEGFRYREIAEIVGCPVGTVMSRLFRARQRLQAALRDAAAERGLVARDPLAA